MARLYFNIKYANSSVLDPVGKDFDDLHAAGEEALDSLREIVARALLSRDAMIPLGISVCTEEGATLREVAVDRAIPEIAQSLRTLGASQFSAAGGTNAKA
ncbi:DUF6894 family protein [Rhizobium laguerreae]|uniref:DUF6894 family protein n=1 Tax=Rhizobium laguerreae TaxID=1076926 RepID=UPI001C900574|nr:hypothetical protein [Rhizobium laguerreae]MBY3249855.1 hypothetical protein [Rhizobium laguerreae]